MLPLLAVLLPRREVARPRQASVGEEAHHGGGEGTWGWLSAVLPLTSARLLLRQVTLTSMELLKNMAVGGGASSLRSEELQISLEEMMDTC